MITVSLEMNTFTTLILVLKLEKMTLKNAIYQEKYLGRTSNFMEGSTDSHKRGFAQQYNLETLSLYTFKFINIK